MDWLPSWSPAPPPPSGALVVVEPPWVAAARHHVSAVFPAPMWGDVAILALLGGLALGMTLYLLWEMSDLGLRICRIAIVAVGVMFVLVFIATIWRLTIAQYGDQYRALGALASASGAWLWESALLVAGGSTQPIKTA